VSPRGFRPARLSALVALACLPLVAGGCGSGASTTAAPSGGSVSTVPPQPPGKANGSAPGGAKFNAADIYARTSPGVVTILSIFGPAGSVLGGSSAGQGSGFVVSGKGEIVTNAHVVTDGGENGNGHLTPARQVYVQFADRNRVPAKILGYDAFADVALIKVDPRGLDLRPLTLADGRGLEVGQPVAAIGSPFGEQRSLSVGVISATDRSIQSLTKFQIDNALQTDASINPGNSGGPLLNALGEVIGINQQIESGSGSNAGVGFAVPVTAVRRSLTQLRASGKVAYAYIGVTTEALYPQLAEHLNLKTKTGALVSDVVKGGPAARAGLKPGNHEIRFEAQRVTVGGDVIVSIDGHRIVDASDLPAAIAAKRPGDTISLQVLRDGSLRQVKLKLGVRPLNIG
jgi:S1-C subfamily serine protease